MSYSLRPHGLQHIKLPCPSQSLRVCSNSCLLSQWCHSTTSFSVTTFSCLQSFLASESFSSESALHIRWPKYWSYSFSISPSSEYSGLISFRIDWFDLLAVQGTLKSLLQHYSSKASVLQRSAFFMVQLSHPCMTTRKTIALMSAKWCLWFLICCLVLSLLFSKVQVSFNFVTVCSDLGAPKIKRYCFHICPIYLPWSNGTGCHDLSFLNVEF